MLNNHAEGFPFDVIDRVIRFSIQHSQLIQEEFAKMVEFYNKNTDQLFDDLAAIRAMKREDYYGDLIGGKADEALNNMGNSQYSFNAKYLLDSHRKVYQQLRETPEDVLMLDPMVKIFFYDILPSPAASGSRLVLSAMILDWREYSARYFALVN